MPVVLELGVEFEVKLLFVSKKTSALQEGGEIDWLH